MTNIAARAAREAGTLLLRYFNRMENIPVEEKQANDFDQEGLSRPRHPRRGERRSRRQRLPVDHRSPGRHHQLPARLSPVFRLHRPAAPRRAGGCRGPRPPARRDLQCAQGRRCLSQRAPYPRLQTQESARRPARHRHPLSRPPFRGPVLRHDEGADQGYRGRAQAWFGSAGLRLAGRRAHRRFLGTGTGAMGLRRRHPAGARSGRQRHRPGRR